MVVWVGYCCGFGWGVDCVVFWIVCVGGRLYCVVWCGGGFWVVLFGCEMFVGFGIVCCGCGDDVVDGLYWVGVDCCVGLGGVVGVVMCGVGLYGGVCDGGVLCYDVGFCCGIVDCYVVGGVFVVDLG